MKQPPEKLSSLIRLALDDLAKCEDDDDYVVDMSIYHFPDDEGCCVCLAGAVIAKTLNAPRDAHISPIPHFGNYQENGGDGMLIWYSSLRAIDMARKGELRAALMALTDMGIPISDELVNFQVTPYSADRESFRRDMFHMAAYLERFGL